MIYKNNALKISLFGILSIGVGLLIAGLTIIVFDQTLEYFFKKQYIKQPEKKIIYSQYPQNTILNSKLKAIAESDLWKNYRPDNFADRNTIEKETGEIESLKFLVLNKNYIIYQKNKKIRAFKETENHKKIFDVNYTTNESSHRVVVQRSSQDEQLLLFGDSFTWGIGVQDEESYPYVLSKLSSNRNVYNLGIPGGSVNDILDDLQNEGYRYKNIQFKKGYSVYVAISDHIQRTTCTLKCFNESYVKWLPQKSNYTYNGHEMIRLGSFEESRPVLNLFYKAINKLFLIQFFKIDFSTFDWQIEKFVLMIKQLKILTEKKFGTKFLFTFYPGTYSYWDEIKLKLAQHQIEYLDYSCVNL